MTDESRNTDHETRLRAVRRRALGNLILGLLDTAARTAERLTVAPLGPDAVLLRYRDVRTLVRRGELFVVAPRDFAIMLACPPAWPFEREAQLAPVILEPHDFAHPNSDGRLFCLDLQGVLPERVPGVIYDELRIALRRLDHVVDAAAAGHVRAHLADFPADPRPLRAAEEPQ